MESEYNVLYPELKKDPSTPHKSYKCFRRMPPTFKFILNKINAELHSYSCSPVSILVYCLSNNWS